MSEFSRFGYAGARMDRIAKRAGFSKGMIYYHFRSKEQLFSAALELAWKDGLTLEEAPDHPVDSIVFWNDFYIRNLEWSRLMVWEGLEWRKPVVLNEKARRGFWRAAVEKMEKAKGAGGWPEFLSVPHYLISLVAIEMAPVLLPHICRLISGQDPTDPKFRKEREEFLRSFAAFVADRKPPKGSGKEPVAAGAVLEGAGAT